MYKSGSFSLWLILMYFQKLSLADNFSRCVFIKFCSRKLKYVFDTYLWLYTASTFWNILKKNSSKWLKILSILKNTLYGIFLLVNPMKFWYPCTFNITEWVCNGYVYITGDIKSSSWGSNTCSVRTFPLPFPVMFFLSFLASYRVIIPVG